MSRSVSASGSMWPAVIDARYPHLSVGARVVHAKQKHLGGTVIRYGWGEGRPWMVRWDRGTTFDGVTYHETHPHLGWELLAEGK